MHGGSPTTSVMSNNASTHVLKILKENL